MKAVQMTEIQRVELLSADDINSSNGRDQGD